MTIIFLVLLSTLLIFVDDDDGATYDYDAEKTNGVSSTEMDNEKRTIEFINTSQSSDFYGHEYYTCQSNEDCATLFRNPFSECCNHYCFSLPSDISCRKDYQCPVNKFCEQDTCRQIYCKEDHHCPSHNNYEGSEFPKWVGARPEKYASTRECQEFAEQLYREVFKQCANYDNQPPRKTLCHSIDLFEQCFQNDKVRSAAIMKDILGLKTSIIQCDINNRMCTRKPNAVETSVTTFVEDGQSFTQENRYNPSTGTLALMVPAHKNYSESTFILLPQTNQQMQRTNGECLLSVRKVNVTQMNEQLKNNNKTFTKLYNVQIRESILSDSERQHLSVELKELCRNSEIIKTVDKTVSQEEFEAFSKQDGQGGNVVVVIEGESVSTQGKCKSMNACTTQGPPSCGYGFPNPAEGGFSAHQLSSGVLCEECCNTIDYGSYEDLKESCQDEYPDICVCADIKHKSELMDCILANNTYDITYEDPSGTFVKQEMRFDVFKGPIKDQSRTRALAFRIPAHDNYEEFNLVMHTADNGYWHQAGLKNNMLMKIGDTCHILDLPADVFPIDLGVNFKQQKQRVVKKENQAIQYTSLEIQYSLAHSSMLHPDIINIYCREVTIVKSERVFMDIKPETTHGCIRWPKPEGGKMVLHEIVSVRNKYLKCNTVTVLGADYADCNGNYKVSEERVSWEPFRPVYKHVTKDRYLFWNKRGYGWSIGRKVDLVNGNNFHTSGLDTSEPWEAPWKKGVTVECSSCGINKCSSAKGCPLVKNKLLATLPKLGKEFSISFEFIATEYIGGWQNVIHFTEDGDCCCIGQRVPALFIKDSGILQPRFSVSGNGSFHSTMDLNFVLEAGQWHKVEFSQSLENGKYIYRVEINRKRQIESENNQPKEFSNVKVYTSDNWYSALKGSIRNLWIKWEG